MSHHPTPERPQHRRRLDQLTLQIGIGAYPSEPPDEVWLIKSTEPREINEVEKILAVLEEQVLRGPTYGEDGEYPHTLEVNEGRFFWGADGATVAIVVYLSLQALNSAVGEATREGLHQTLRFVRDLAQNDLEVAYSNEQMETEARWRIEVAYKETPDDLMLIIHDHDRDAERWEYTFDGKHGRYLVTMGVVDGIPYTSRTRRDTTGTSGAGLS